MIHATRLIFFLTMFSLFDDDYHWMIKCIIELSLDKVCSLAWGWLNLACITLLLEMFSLFQTFSVFLETLSEFILAYHEHISDWLFILMTRLLQKMGSDLLPSLINRIEKTIDLVR